MTKPKVVLDTNIYLSGIIFGGNCRHIIDLVINEKIIVAISPGILLELSDKLKIKFGWDKNQIVVTLKTIAKTAILVTPKMKLQIVKKDKNDNKILEAGIESGANFIITGDKHLLDIKKYKSIKIVSPSQFLSLYFKK